MANRQKDSSKLRIELDALPNVPENLELRQWYWKQIADARKREFQSAKLTHKKGKERKQIQKVRPTGNLGAKLALEEQKQKQKGE